MIQTNQQEFGPYLFDPAHFEAERTIQFFDATPMGLSHDMDPQTFAEHLADGLIDEAEWRKSHPEFEEIGGYTYQSAGRMLLEAVADEANPNGLFVSEDLVVSYRVEAASHGH